MPDCPLAGKMIPIQQVLSGFTTEFEDANIYRRNRTTTMKIHCDPPAGFYIAWGGEDEDGAKAQGYLFASIPKFLVIMILTVIGVTVGLLAFDQPFGFMALLGMLSLSGMLIKNAIVLIDQIDLEIREGKDHYLAVVDSGVSRLRPVSMAAITTILGMLPLFADAFFVAMAVTIAVGLGFATVLTLIVVPVLYTVFFRIPSPKAAKA